MFAEWMLAEQGPMAIEQEFVMQHLSLKPEQAEKIRTQATKLNKELQATFLSMSERPRYSPEVMMAMANRKRRTLTQEFLTELNKIRGIKDLKLWELPDQSLPYLGTPTARKLLELTEPQQAQLHSATAKVANFTRDNMRSMMAAPDDRQSFAREKQQKMVDAFLGLLTKDQRAHFAVLAR